MEAPRFGGRSRPYLKPLPNPWVIGRGVGVWVDDHHVWIVRTGNTHLDANERAPAALASCTAAPPCWCSTDRNLVRLGVGRFTVPGGQPRVIHVDYKGNVWIGEARRIPPPVHQESC